MPTSDVTLESLTQVIESVQDAIRREGRTIGANETRTRNTLIDPVLSALGWSDPSVVTQEYLIRYGAREFEYGVVDYAFHPPGDRAHPMAFLEAKRMLEDLTDDHHEQVCTYALDQGGKLRQFGLTNGDIWEFYELNEGEPSKMFEFSIQRQSASDCADILLRHFLMLTRPSAERLTEPLEALSPLIRNAETTSTSSEIHIVPSRSLSNGVDVPKTLIWLAVSLIVFGILGWASGVWRAGPVEGFFEYVGLFTFVLVTILIVALIRRFFPSVSSVVLRILRFNWLFTPINGNRRKTLVWVGIALVCGIAVGGVGGHFIGLQMAQSVANTLKILGQVAVVTTGIVIVVLVGSGISRNSGKRRPGGWKLRSSYRKRRW